MVRGGMPVDELREALVLASDDERESLIELLFRPRFNPLDYVQTLSPEAVRNLPYGEQCRAIESRLYFLAADGLTVLRGQTRRLRYHHLLLQACQFLRISCQPHYSVTELEAELFLHVLQQSWKQLPAAERSLLAEQIHSSLRQNSQGFSASTPGLQRDTLRLALEGGSALALSAVIRPLVLEQIARQIMLHTAKRQVAREALKQGGSAAARMQGYVAAQMAGRGVAVNLARYSAARSLLAFLGPALWAWFFADLGWRAIATNHSRTIPALFLLAQIRLTRAEYSAEAS